MKLVHECIKGESDQRVVGGTNPEDSLGVRSGKDLAEVSDLVVDVIFVALVVV